MPSIDQYTRREARIRGSGNREIKVEELNILSPKDSVDSEDSVQKQDIYDKEIQRQDAYDKEPQKQDSKLLHDLQASSKIEAKKEVREEAGLRDKRKIIFSSDDDNDDDDFMNHTPDFDQSATPEVKQEVQVKQEPDPPKRRRGRPRKGEVEKKAVVTVTRRSRRVEENPALQKSHEVPRYTQPKPFSSMSLFLAQKGWPDHPSGVRLLGLNSRGKQRPLTIDAERFYSASTRDRRFNLTTLDVLKHFVEEHSPRPSANDSINENVVLTEFKAHLKYYITHLQDLHASVNDINNDLASVQRKKNDVRRSILELKKKHSGIGAQLSVERRKYYEMKEKHLLFMLMVSAIGDLKTAIHSESLPPDLSGDVLLSLNDMQRIFNPVYGMPAQLRYVLDGLTEMTKGKENND